MSGDNWEIKTASGATLAGPIDVYASPFNKNPNISQKSVTLVSNLIFSATSSDCASLTLTGLDPGEEYLLTLYGFGFESAGARKMFFATSDDSAVFTIDQNEFGLNNGQPLKYKYKASDNGIFSVSTTPDNNVWNWFAFSNEEYIPEPATALSVAFCCLLFRRYVIVGLIGY